MTLMEDLNILSHTFQRFSAEQGGDVLEDMVSLGNEGASVASTIVNNTTPMKGA
eukprot:CAMPEP_0170161034 /NCGR_PEP_ID=MMETSP0033_2-20121228/75047_1 /TAXON_ID=195969 /ORGANISM="Dolichomastix tenuilepis, Strain CCMP3274" /LENGTH=53 /DNA_ID=CAMNT_0010398623 /DNA_START=27 /DNA_END=184 /DNA_ORIENTATION=+